jgi:hypothetical protein
LHWPCPWRPARRTLTPSALATALGPRPSYIRDTTLRLSGKVEDLEDVMAAMAVLDEVRVKDANIDAHIGPIEEMYGLLLRYEVCGGAR